VLRQKTPGQNAVMFVNAPPGIDDLSASISKNGTPSSTGARYALAAKGDAICHILKASDRLCPGW